MSIYNFAFKTSEGKEISLGEHAGKVMLIVNTATKCGLAGQFAELETLHMKYKDKGLVVVGFPCDQFMGQEPETNETVSQVCLINFGVTFTLSEKIMVNGDETHSLFKYLKQELPGGILGSGIKWNFTKFLVGKDGKPYKRYAPLISPLVMEGDIVELLG